MLDGEIDEIIDALITTEQSENLAVEKAMGNLNSISKKVVKKISNKKLNKKPDILVNNVLDI